MNKTVLVGVVGVLAVFLISWYFLSPSTFMGIGISETIQPPALPE